MIRTTAICEECGQPWTYIRVTRPRKTCSGYCEYARAQKSWNQRGARTPPKDRERLYRERKVRYRALRDAGADRDTARSYATSDRATNSFIARLREVAGAGQG